MQSAGAVQKRRFPHWVHILAQIIVAGFCIYWYFDVPVPNKAVLILTGVTVVIALLDMHPSQKAVYLVLVMVLMFIENRAINQDRAEVLKADDDRRREETTNFQAVLEGIRGSVENSQHLADATMARLNATLDRVEDSIKTQTGGDSFAYVTFVPQPNQQFVVAITSRGKYPLREIRVTMMDDERRLQAMQEYNQHPGGNWIAVINAADSVFQIPYLRPQSSEAPSP
jgi:murein DD-endopeptidase MepM/ murein hydrolase activator NlpD